MGGNAKEDESINGIQLEVKFQNPPFNPIEYFFTIQTVAKKCNCRHPVVATVLVGSTFLLKKNEKPFRLSLTGHEACMYWTGDHYQPISCSQKVKDTLVIALDSTRLVGFKRIMQEDTITSKSIGIVWYARLKGQIEYYTSEGNGNHPVELGTPLHRLTPYMLKTHIKAKQ